MKTVYLVSLALVGFLTSATAMSYDKGSPQFVMNAIYNGQGSTLTLVGHGHRGHHRHHHRGHHYRHHGGVYIGADPYWHYRLNYPYYQRPGFSFNLEVPIRPRPYTKRMDCRIKGYVMKNGAHVYYAPNHRDYNKIKMNSRAGDRWFCNEKQAFRAGWRPAS